MSANDLGTLLLSYRFLQTEGRDIILNYDIAGDGDLRSRLDMNVIDLDYQTRDWSLGSHLDIDGVIFGHPRILNHALRSANRCGIRCYNRQLLSCAGSQ